MIREIVRLETGEARANVALRGAELRSWSVDGVDLLWTPDPSVWPETAPVLFPVVGWTKGHRIRVHDTDYPLGLHGFARTLDFAVREQWPGHVRLGLRDTPQTRALYPFAFDFEAEYALTEDGLDVALTIANPGPDALPYACGLHPGFRWPFASAGPEDYEIVFAEREASQVPVISPDGLFTRQSRRIPIDGRHLALSGALLEREALCFLNARSKRLSFRHRGGAAIEVALENFPHLALWSRPPAPFLCIEAWTGHGDYVDADGDVFTKASMRVLAPGASARHAAKFSFARPHLLFRDGRLAEVGKPDR